MSLEIDDGGTAFPYPTQGGRMCGGMSKREWFAGQALIGLLAGGASCSEAVPSAAMVADDMLAVLRPKQGNPEELAEIRRLEAELAAKGIGGHNA